MNWESWIDSNESILVILQLPGSEGIGVSVAGCVASVVSCVEGCVVDCVEGGVVDCVVDCVEGSVVDCIAIVGSVKKKRDFTNTKWYFEQIFL